MRRSLEAKGAPLNDEALNILRGAGCPPNVIMHCRYVAENAVELALKAVEKGFPVDLKLVKSGALLHDIGRAVVHDVRHGVKGAEIARSIGVDERVVRIIENHIGAGIPAMEASSLGLPEKNYTPTTVEEKIVCYADKLTRGSRMINFREALREFKKTLGSDHPAVSRFKMLHKDILKITRDKV